MLAVRWYLRYSLSYRDVEELLAERGITVDTSRSTGGDTGASTAGQRDRRTLRRPHPPQTPTAF